MKSHLALAQLVLALFLSGCGVKQEDHDRVINDLSQARHRLGEVEKAKSELQKSVEDVETAKSELQRLINETRTRLFAIESDLRVSQNRVAELSAEIEKLKT